MAYRGGGGGGRGGGEQQPPAYGGRAAPMGGRGGGGAPMGFVWPPPGAGPLTATPATAAYQQGAVYRVPAPTPVRAPSPSSATVRAPSPAAAPFQPARISAPPASIAKELEQNLFVTETALAPPTAATVEASHPAAEKVPEVDLAPVSMKGMAHPARPGACTAEKKVMIRANHFLIKVADNNLFH